MKYRGFVKPSRRKLLVIEDLPLEAAIEFLKDYKDGIIEDESGKELTEEELKNVETIRSLPGIEYDNYFTGGGEISKDSDRELFGTITDNPEPSTKRDN